jgi:hypothetical protein
MEELLSIKEGLRSFRSIILGFPIEVHTDHKNLIYSNFENARVQCWRLALEEYSPSIVYRPGPDNPVANALSRLPLSLDALVQMVQPLPSLSFPLDLQTISAYQHADTDFQQLLSTHFQPSTAPVTSSLPVTFQWFGDYTVLCTDHATPRILIPAALHATVLDFYHSHLSHPGKTKMYESMHQTVHWPNMKQDVIKKVQLCEECKLSKNVPPRYRHSPMPNVETTPWNVDLIRPYNKTLPNNIENQYKYALTIMDPVTRWIEIIVLKNMTSKYIAEMFDKEWLCHYPRPTRCVFDHGTEFNSNEFLEMLDSYRIKPVKITVRNPQANSILEQVHHVIGNALRTLDPSEDWTSHCPAIAFAIRASFNRVLNATPAQVVFGCDMINPIKLFKSIEDIATRKEQQSRKDNVRINSKQLGHKFENGQEVYLFDNRDNRPKLQKPYSTQSLAFALSATTCQLQDYAQVPCYPSLRHSGYALLRHPSMTRNSHHVSQTA